MTLSCGSHGNPKWYYMNTEKLPNRFPFSNESTLRFFNVGWKDAGFYFCYGAYSYLITNHVLTVALLQISGRLYVLISFLFIKLLIIFK